MKKILSIYKETPPKIWLIHTAMGGFVGAVMATLVPCVIMGLVLALMSLGGSNPIIMAFSTFFMSLMTFPELMPVALPVGLGISALLYPLIRYDLLQSGKDINEITGDHAINSAWCGSILGWVGMLLLAQHSTSLALVQAIVMSIGGIILCAVAAMPFMYWGISAYLKVYKKYLQKRGLL